jgi:hypothetical protein
MNKEISKQETKVVDSEVVSTPAVGKPALDPAVMAAIQVAVSTAMSALITELKPAVAALPGATTPAMTDGVAHVPARPKPVLAQSVYKTKLQGIPVNPGEDLRYVPAAEINAWFAKVERRWQERMNNQKMGDGAVNVNWTRG